ncbi:FkbM family methyltransferase [Candidatus Pelagibacter ubique]|nr:FkbM family methyltransferase [Candidatus Pelagibacter ubique]
MIKQFLIKNSFLFNIYLIYFYFKFNFFTKKESYSQFGEDIIINKYFKSFIGTYVDIGCYHPIKYSNTALFYKKGWNGTNIDLNQTSINLFNFSRLRDKNILACLSNKEEWVDVYLDNEFSALNSTNKENIKNFKIKNFKKNRIKTKIFPKIIKKKFDFLNIDCEGNDYKILKTINLQKYKPKLICVEVSKESKKSIYNYLNSNNYEILTVRSLSHIFKYKN